MPTNDRPPAPEPCANQWMVDALAPFATHSDEYTAHLEATNNGLDCPCADCVEDE